MDRIPDIIALTETKLHITKHKNAKMPKINGFKFKRKDTNSRAGGVGFYIRTSINYKIRPDLDLNVKDTEDLWLEITLEKNKKMYVAVLYRHPRHNYNDFQFALLHSIEKLNKNNSNFYIFGDQNINLLRYHSNNSVKTYLDLLNCYNCHCLIDKPTRIDGSKISIIDHIYTNDLSHQIVPGIITTDTSDHFPTFAKITLPKVERLEEQIKVRDMKNFNEELFLVDLNAFIHSFNFETCTVDNAFRELQNTLTKLVNKHAPFRYLTAKEKRRYRQPWVTKGIIKSIRKKNKLYRKTKGNNNIEILEKYKKYRNSLNRTITAAKRKHNKERILVASNKSKAMWQVINETLGSNKKQKRKITKIKKENGEYTVDKQEIANLFNEYFVNVGKKMSDTIPNVPNNICTPSIENSFFMKLTTGDEIFQLINKLDENKAKNLIDIPTKFIKLANNLLSPILSVLFNRCVHQGVYPDPLKIAQVIPIYKEGVKTDCSNYRPISILCQFNKVYEKLMYSRLINFFNKNDILSREQYGFRKKSSTAYAIYDVIEEKLKNLDKNNFTCALYLDLSKAFDTVNHKILLQKLNHYGIRGLPLKMIQSYLLNRKQFTLVNGTKSEERSINIGVPQGSVLGPLLFLLYINDLPLASCLHTKLFADDTCLIFSATTLDELQIIINQEIKKIDLWMSSNKLSLNYKKTKYMLIHRKNDRSHLNLYINNKKIEQTRSIKYLGVKIDENLNWREHIKYVETKISQACGAIYKLRNFVDQDCLRTLYYGYAYSFIQYACLAWGTASKTALRKVQMRHQRLIRAMTLHGPLENMNFSANEMAKNINVLKFEDVFTLELAKFMHRAYYNKLPSTLENFFTKTEMMHRYNLRSRTSHRFYLPHCRTAKYRKSFKILGIELWNKLANELKSVAFLSPFAKKYKKSLIEYY